MNVPPRLRPLAGIARFVSLSLLFAATCYAADFSQVPAHRSKFQNASLKAATADAALFEFNDAARAARLAHAEIGRFPREVNGWFLAMEAASLSADQDTKLKSIVEVCKLAKPGDPRALIASMRLAGSGDNSKAFASHQLAVEALSIGATGCQQGAAQALYEASLRGLPDTNVRATAHAAGWLTRWTIRRVAGNTPAEEFEFPDARIRIPDYFPRMARYSAQSEITVTTPTRYSVLGDLESVVVTIDGREVRGPIDLAIGTHTVGVAFRAAEANPRIRIAPTQVFDDNSLTSLRLPKRQVAYIRSAALMAVGQREQARAEFEASTVVASTAVEDLLFGQSATPIPDPLERTRGLIRQNRHQEAAETLAGILHEWPLDRDARSLRIAELQRVGNIAAADRAAAEFLAIAPNARMFRRMAQQAASTTAQVAEEPFYARYRRPAPFAIPGTLDPSVILLQDKVAISRPDGSVSLYVHRVVQVMNMSGVQAFQPLPLPQGAEVLASRIVNSSASLASGAKPGDEIEEEYVVHFTGDGGMAAHPEAFQYVFNDFDAPLLDARFVVLSPAGENPGYVISSGEVPHSRVEFAGGLRSQVWQRTATIDDIMLAPSIVRVVENENGWSVPPSVERRRILETIHPGPRNREA